MTRGESLPPLEGILGRAYEVVIDAIASGFSPPPPLRLNSWAKDNIVFGKESGHPGPYDPDLCPFFKEVLECLEPDHPARTVVLMKSAQLGGTILANIFIGAYLDLDPGPLLYIHPSLDNAKRWVRTKWNPFVRQSEALKDIFPEEKSRNTTDTIYYKERADGRGHLLITGSNSPASLSMISYGTQVQDDLSKWENDDQAGDPESLADSRAKAFPYAKVFKISTPLIKGACRISAAYELSDKRELEVPCPHCGHYQTLEWENFRKSIHEGMETEKAHFTCVKNGCVIEHCHKRKMVAKYRWVSRNPSSKVPGFRIWSAYSPFMDWALIADNWLKAVGNPQKEKTFYNDDLGLPYEQKGEAPPWQSIKQRVELEDLPAEQRALRTYAKGRIPVNALLITCGVDCQGDRIEWHVKGFGPNLRRYTIDHGVIEGHISQERPRAQLDALLKRTWPNAYGRQIGIDMMAVDANYDTQQVLDWCKKHPESKVIAIRGAKGEHAPPLMLVKTERIKGVRVRKYQKRFFNLGVSGMKIALFKQLEITDPHARGFCGYPIGLDDEFFKQLCSERRVTVINKRTHFATLEWQKLPGTRNEILDTEIYAEAAARRRGWTELSDAEWDRFRAERESPPKELQGDLLDANMAKDLTSGELTPFPDVDVPVEDSEEDEDIGDGAAAGGGAADAPPPTTPAEAPAKSVAAQLA